MASIRCRAQTGKLFIDFKYQGIRCREQTALPDTKENRKKLEIVAQKIDASITLGQFNYVDFFPQSKMVEKFARRDQHLKSLVDGNPILTVDTFRVQWFEEMRPTWRNSYEGSIQSIFDRHILPAFGDKVVNHITKADILQFRARLAKASPETGRESKATTVNKILKIFRLMMREAARLTW
jgi:integrase